MTHLDRSYSLDEIQRMRDLVTLEIACERGAVPGHLLSATMVEVEARLCTYMAEGVTARELWGRFSGMPIAGPQPPEYAEAQR